MPPHAVRLRASGRTVVGRPGGALRDASVTELALVAGLSVAHGVRPDLVVAAQAVSPALDLAARIADHAAAPQHAQTAGANAGTVALAMGLAAVAGGAARAVLVVGAESASQAPYWVPALRWGAHEGGAEVTDPLAAVVASRAEAEVPGDRARLDAWAQRSHAAAAAPAAPAHPVGDATTDELPGGGQERLAALKPLLHHEGTLTAGSVALPADGAAAVLLAADGDGPALSLGAPQGPVGAAEVGEADAQEALGLIAALGLDPGIVNAAGGAIGFGHPVAATPLMMLGRLAHRLAPGQMGLLNVHGVSFMLRA